MFEVRNILEIDPGEIEVRPPEEQKALSSIQKKYNPGAVEVRPLQEQKALLAMRATKLFVDNDAGYEEANAQLLSVAKYLDEPATMTYEDVVLRNACGDDFCGTLFVLSDDPAVATQEAEFFECHKNIESALGGAIKALIDMGSSYHLYGRGANPHGMMPGSNTEPNETTAPLRLKYVNAVVKGLYRELDPESFNKFRPYFVGLNGYPGPSGLYSAAIPVLDLLVHGGSNISTDERTQMRKNLEHGLYPPPAAMLKTLLDKEDPMLDIPDKNREELVNKLNAFRRIHRSSVKKFVPGAENGTADGSGGVANVPEYLNSKILTKEKEKEDD